jgi:hypothetical protein
MDLPVCGNRLIDLIQEAQQLLMSWLALRDNRFLQNIERCKQCSGSMAPVIMRLLFRKTFRQGSTGCWRSRA